MLLAGAGDPAQKASLVHFTRHNHLVRRTRLCLARRHGASRSADAVAPAHRQASGFLRSAAWTPPSGGPSGSGLPIPRIAAECGENKGTGRPDRCGEVRIWRAQPGNPMRRTAATEDELTRRLELTQSSDKPVRYRLATLLRCSAAAQKLIQAHSRRITSTCVAEPLLQCSLPEVRASPAGSTRAAGRCRIDAEREDQR